MRLVKTTDIGIDGHNYHVVEAKLFNITPQELEKIGATQSEALVAERLLKLLQKADQQLRKHGYRLFVKDGYRSKKLYELAAKNRRVHHSKNKPKHSSTLKICRTLLD